MWLQATALDDINGLTTQIAGREWPESQQRRQQTLLKSTFASGLPQAAGFTLPYAGFPLTSTLAQALRPFPQFTNIKVEWDPRGNAWYDALQAKLTQRFKHGLNRSIRLHLAEGVDHRGRHQRQRCLQSSRSKKAISPSSLPFVVVIAFSYTIPKAPIQNKVVSCGHARLDFRREPPLPERRVDRVPLRHEQPGRAAAARSRIER